MRSSRDFSHAPQSMHPDDRADELLDRVLTGLRDAAPTPGLERRVLTSLQARHHSAAVWLSPQWRRPNALAAMAALLLVAGAIGWAIHPHTHGRHWSARDQQPASNGPLPPPARTVAATKGSAEPATRVHRARQAGFAASRMRPPAEPSRESGANEPDAIAQRETQAPSQPAPVMPLTAQERLLLRIIRHGDPVELAALDPAVRAALFAEDKAQFHKFFDHPEDGEKQ